MFVVATVRKHVPDVDKGSVTSRLSNRDKYLSVTITFTAESQAQLDAIYQELTDSGRVVMLF
jgi:putative lipoic acid-binding regulatory protein